MAKELSFFIGGHGIHGKFYDVGTVSLRNDYEFVQAVKAGGAYRAANDVKVYFKASFDKDLDISTNSLGVEIVGHIMAVGFAPALKAIRNPLTGMQMIPDSVIESVEDIVNSRIDWIDCGVKGQDSNRWVWDILSTFVGANTLSDLL